MNNKAKEYIEGVVKDDKITSNEKTQLLQVWAVKVGNLIPKMTAEEITEANNIIEYIESKIKEINRK